MLDGAEEAEIDQKYEQKPRQVDLVLADLASGERVWEYEAYEKYGIRSISSVISRIKAALQRVGDPRAIVKWVGRNDKGVIHRYYFMTDLDKPAILFPGYPSRLEKDWEETKQMQEETVTQLTLDQFDAVHSPSRELPRSPALSEWPGENENQPPAPDSSDDERVLASVVFAGFEDGHVVLVVNPNKENVQVAFPLDIARMVFGSFGAILDGLPRRG